MHCYIYKNDAQTVSILYVSGELTDEETIKKSVPSGTECIKIMVADLPDKNFLDAWEIDNKTKQVSINFDKAREKTKNRLRLERVPMLEAQDVLFMRAQESSADTSAIVAEKQRLRDITKSVDACTELAELSALKCKS